MNVKLNAQSDEGWKEDGRWEMGKGLAPSWRAFVKVRVRLQDSVSGEGLEGGDGTPVVLVMNFLGLQSCGLQHNESHRASRSSFGSVPTSLRIR